MANDYCLLEILDGALSPAQPQDLVTDDAQVLTTDDLETLTA